MAKRKPARKPAPLPVNAPVHARAQAKRTSTTREPPKPRGGLLGAG